MIYHSLADKTFNGGARGPVGPTFGLSNYLLKQIVFGIEMFSTPVRQGVNVSSTDLYAHSGLNNYSVFDTSTRIELVFFQLKRGRPQPSRLLTPHDGKSIRNMGWGGRSHPPPWRMLCGRWSNYCRTILTILRVEARVSS